MEERMCSHLDCTNEECGLVIDSLVYSQEMAVGLKKERDEEMGERC